MHLLLVATSLLAVLEPAQAEGPFFQTVDPGQYIIGNDIWNVTIGSVYGRKLFYENRDLVGNAAGYYLSYNEYDGSTNLTWISASIYKQTADFLDVSFSATEGDLHWVIYSNLSGAYQYFVNHALPILGEFRTLWRLDPNIFFNGKTSVKDEALPTFADIKAARFVQDQTWQAADGQYITKYDWADFIRNNDYYGVYGPDFGSWFIYPGKDEYNGDQLKQELTVHREGTTGDVVQLNMLHGTHFMASCSDFFADGKVWGPWLWYLNNGSIDDVSSRAQSEKTNFPYSWFDDVSYQSRGQVVGELVLSDSRPASGAAVFLGDNNPNETSLDMGRFNYYTTYANVSGYFEFENVRSGMYSLQAWSNGGAIGDVSTTYLQNDVLVTTGATADLGVLSWKTQEREKIFQIGDMDRKSLGFKYGGVARQHGLVTKCPTNLIYNIGTSNLSDWCFGQSAIGTWTIQFNIAQLPNNTAAVLSVSLAGYSSGVNSSIILNKQTTIGNLQGCGVRIASDPCMYRSANLAGEWHYYEFPVDEGLLDQGLNTIDFVVTDTSLWHGFMWDSVMLEFA